MDFYNDRRPDPRDDGDAEHPLDRDSLRNANARLRASAPAYRQEEINRKIRTTAVRRHRARKAGRDDDFRSTAEYVNFIWGADSGSI